MWDGGVECLGSCGGSSTRPSPVGPVKSSQPVYKPVVRLSTIFPQLPSIPWCLSSTLPPFLTKTPFEPPITMVGSQHNSSPYFEDGFFPSQAAAPLLPSQWDCWEDVFSKAVTLGPKSLPSPEGIPKFKKWIESVPKARTHLHRTRHTDLGYLDCDFLFDFLDASIAHARTL